MGPYCQFCNQRCFVYFPDDTPGHILDAYRKVCPTVTIIAACPGGQAYERKKIGYCYQDIVNALNLKGA